MADMYGDKSAVEIDLHYAPAGAMISHLFEHYDKDKNGIENRFIWLHFYFNF